MKAGRLILPLFAITSVALAQINQSQNGPAVQGSTQVVSTNTASPTIDPSNPGAAAGAGGTDENKPTAAAPADPNQTAAVTGTQISGLTNANGSPTAGAPTVPPTANASQTATNGPVVIKQGGSNTGVLRGLTILFAILFAAALAAAIFFFVKRRQDKRKAYVSPSYSSPENGAYSDKGANARVEALQTQLADANKRLTAVQGSLLAAGQKPQTKDDNTLSREYTQIGTDLVGWAGNYFKASSDPINLTTELYEFLTEHVPNYQSLLTSGKSKQLVVRAIVSQVLQESFENGAFFGNALAAITPLIRTSTASATAMNNWRSETFFLLEKSDDFASQRRAAISTISDRIEQLTYPLAASKQSFQGDSARYKFLEGIIKKAGDFALALGKQRANFQILSEPAGCEFGHATMDDVSQQTDVTTGADGSTSHPLEGRPIQATVFPLLLKYGNEAGEAYDQITILSKAKVLV
ncbi:hypothetical protein ABW21_db0208345 [Orbilia brochopaga]|nr:hypothetical protein ABW21_db0208345 [Drechslerella brochopaga]